MIQIPIGKGQFALIDDCDIDLLWAHTWSGYARTSIKRKNYLIIGRRKFLNYFGFLDHEDRNKFNCQRNNLRKATRNQNAFNMGLSSTGYKEVSYLKKKDKFLARIIHNQKQIHLGLFIIDIEAYDQAAIKLCGEFAVLNFPESK
jgi:hypothetical protein